MCHEASGFSINPAALAIGKGTVEIDEFRTTPTPSFVFGQNPGTNHPRMLRNTKRSVKRGAQLLSFNTLRERGF